MWFLLDVIIVLIFVLFAISGAKKGFIKSICGIVVTIASILIAMNLSAPVAEFFRDSVVYEQLTDNLHGKIEEYISDAMDEKKL